ncbi:GNAT family N-acetyltransferase [Thermoactinomyces intermedius]|uniref:GNAT family N-acetyltransferase n=1 Tax=Thermoactinomyces intermedius TaxID=2024 RepID=A0A8I1AF02_THEIN|nr:GNAT family N-acetyltransferase [Thermoactinomyces intermedius]MBA4549464.1 GNAT family N-acetyltransferase [Thermoactinomyces intermedius]MBA4836897.1 GNAT family N-acetyltransferase [Thermoactinomyces intermedius]MBH8594828.1 GNAT family N-acetyltransferase [Thermoactinomyces intermedius]
MKIHAFPPQSLERIRKPLLRFLRRYGDGRITHQAMRWFHRLTPEELKEGTYIAAAYDEKKVAGIIVFGNYGIEESFIAVHPDYRQRGVGEQLLKQAIQSLGKVYARVASDNIPSLKLCFSCGLMAFSLCKGPTGKDTLWLGGGNFDPADVLKKSEPSVRIPVPEN